MSVDISNLTIAVPVAESSISTVAVELTGSEAIALYPNYVTVLSDGSVQLSAPTKGASSKSTRRTRCEWSEPEYWSLGGALDHWNRQEMTLTKVNWAQKVVIAQMHVYGDDSPPVKVFWKKGDITLGFRRTYNQADPVNSTVLKGVPLGSKFEVSIHATSAGVVTVTAKYNGVTGSSGDLQFDSTWASRLFEFHGGVYNQVDYSDTTPADDGSICIISDLSLIHA
ncbi:polysaccharide lyase family 7 protein [Pseudomonas asiatica]|uniref:polysaccharide lyase family 7 protein n=1 Tax=Pseudomonas TaxID=286 RepID=UPI0002173B8B|nr:MULTISPECIES: polysaccharide lyase family 7 protein [Pseudomonas]AEJ13792.1 alginate lyase 2 [Pseudomonas putida S16]MBF8806222.1 polysaccharide lyase family 7 protein [Pseudomonas asiatica]MBH3380176.1 polysaccharide lyase family 7 protein [Pseudomonas asiatica]MBO2892292.1 polysaccharide lyase family 7 protein [Pseudomonas asiatica]MCK2123685.1 polysaccharide lyase family 7 protein [Pseudomonas sp. PNPG3]